MSVDCVHINDNGWISAIVNCVIQVLGICLGATLIWYYLYFGLGTITRNIHNVTHSIICILYSLLALIYVNSWWYDSYIYGLVGCQALNYLIEVASSAILLNHFQFALVTWARYFKSFSNERQPVRIYNLITVGLMMIAFSINILYIHIYTVADNFNNKAVCFIHNNRANGKLSILFKFLVGVLMIKVIQWFFLIHLLKYQYEYFNWLGKKKHVLFRQKPFKSKSGTIRKLDLCRESSNDRESCLHTRINVQKERESKAINNMSIIQTSIGNLRILIYLSFIYILCFVPFYITQIVELFTNQCVSVVWMITITFRFSYPFLSNTMIIALNPSIVKKIYQRTLDLLAPSQLTSTDDN